MRRPAPGRPRNRDYDTRILGEVVRELAASGFRDCSIQPDTGSLCGDLAHTVHEWAEMFRSEELARLIGRIEVKHLQSIGGPEAITPGFEREIVRTVARSLLVRPGGEEPGS